VLSRGPSRRTIPPATGRRRRQSSSLQVNAHASPAAGAEELYRVSYCMAQQLHIDKRC